MSDLPRRLAALEKSIGPPPVSLHCAIEATLVLNLGRGLTPVERLRAAQLFPTWVQFVVATQVPPRPDGEGEPLPVAAAA